MSMASSTTDLDEYMWEEILKRLPVKTLVGFRCVSKQWNSLISSPSFANNHRLSFTTTDDSNKSCLLLLFNSLPDSLSAIYCFYNPQQPHLAHQLSFSPVPFAIVGDRFQYMKPIDVVHGVVCLSHCSLKSTFLTLLWNPALHKYVEIPLPGEQPSLVVGFGFAGRTNAFKLVRNLTPGDLNSSIEVFSTQEKQWRGVQTEHIGPFSLSYSKRGCFKNGVIHWIGKTVESEEVMLLFDCESKEFKTMPLPRELGEHEPRRLLSLFISCCSGKLSVLAIRVMEDERSLKVAAWVMEEYGVLSSWRKLKPDQVDIVRINDHHVYQLKVDDNPLPFMWKAVDKINTPHQPFDGFAFEPSLFLMDGNSLASSE